ncbi:uncharacterized protein LOC116709857 [Xiphophorus hellerii]|uniref:uncharacterized protein LOC116708419 n=1 Tax=Xiphophorus hellerii TaxID=8084 RepID=UPI0013B447F1|nr:uncharacterized protein LOC116708419 [Xiphophorus hellerii]XP_032404421.1 uncharacterized protein LOC116709857 [Xiphophorus hellerii]
MEASEKETEYTEDLPVNEEEEPPCSVRQKKPTEKMRAYQEEEAHKKEKRLIKVYNQWKRQVRMAREQLKGDITNSQIASLMDILEKERDGVINLYTEIREIITPCSDTRRLIDACEAVTNDIIRVAYERLSGIDDYDSGKVKARLRELLNPDYAQSIYSSSITYLSKRSDASNSNSARSVVAVKRAEAAAELAAKEAEYEVLLEEEKQRERIQLLEERQRKELESQKRELERLKAEKELKAARARLITYDHEIKSESSVHVDSTRAAQKASIVSAPIQVPKSNIVSTSPPQADVLYLAQALQDSVTMNRLPMPEPSTFTGDPIEFIEWKASFAALIDKRNISPADKLYYLKKYVGGSARQTLDGIFYRNDSDAYQDAWERLNQRYGHPFIVQKAYRERLAKWPKIQTNDSAGFRAFADFIQTCHEAMPHIEGLSILNDCEENQKLVQKLPNWAAARWNRQATQYMKENGKFPSLRHFTEFMSSEAEIVCNPITSFQALHSTDVTKTTSKVYQKEKRPTSSVLHTQVVTETESTKQRSNIKPPCMLCQDNGHKLHSCPQFKGKSLEERRKYIKDKRLCYGCLKPGHSAKDCRYRLACEMCKKKHPTCLHDFNYDSNKSQTNQIQTNTEQAATTLSLNAETNEQCVSTSMIVPVWVSSEQQPDEERLVYALLDTQSDTVFINQEVSNSLKAKSTPIRLRLTTMLGKNAVVPSERVSGLKVRGYNSSEIIELPPAYTKDCIPVNRSHIPSCETARQWDHLKVIVNEIPPQLECEVGLLIGYNCSKALAPRQVILGGEGEPYAVCTALGWSIVGPTSSHNDSFSISTVCHRVTVKELPLMTPTDALKILESDFKDDSKDNKSVSQDDILFLNTLKEGIYKNNEGHYEMPLPFKERPLLPDNKQMATVRLQSLKNKLSKDQRYKEQYVKFMGEVIEKGDAEEVQNEAKEGERWYIPHHGIYHPQKPDKLRVVFDASAKYKGNSLNDHLLSGPDLLNNLNGVLIRFRRHQVALLCDIEKMFHQFHVYEADRDYLRFLWWKNGNLNTEPQEFRMKVHLFGATSSPGCANYGLKHLATENETQFPLASQFIMKDFYVDDGVTSTASVKEAIQLAQEAQTLCASGGLRLHKFVSNDKTVLESIPSSERASPLQACDLAFNDSKLERALGIHWHIDSDTLRFRFQSNDQPATRRGILSMVASLYDPLGFISPFVLTGKRVLQETCKQGTGWDDPLPSELKPVWDNWKDDLKNLEKITMSRCYVPKDFGQIVKTELHHFSDASSYGYGQCSYLRYVNKDDKVYCALVTAKTRVAPIKVTTIPRLELTAAVVSIIVSNMLKDELGLTQIDEYFWTDSKVVLGYINNEARRFHTFVSNRVQKIRLNSTPQQWRYISSEQNPADIASRGSSAGELISSDWFKGPQFLWDKEIPPAAKINMDLPLGDPEVKRAHALNTFKTEKKGLADKLTKFSSWYKSTQAVARLIRCAKRDKTTGHSTAQERRNAECVILKDVQANEYPEEIKMLKHGKALPHKSKLFQMDTFLDSDGLLKVGGRLKDASFSSSLKHPVLVPKGHHVTQLLIAHFHSKVQHQGKGMTINEIRSNGIWIPGINRAVTKFIHQCVKCRRLRRGTEEQRMSDLPKVRLEPLPPFTFCGMDCFGPFLTKQARKVHKRYGLLFTCLCCRAVHIEMLDDMTTDAFINALRCFIAIRGAVSEIKCDQGSNFVGAKNELQEALQQVDTNRIITFLAEKQCDFNMHTPHSSHTGGVWERQIRTVRNILRSTASLSSGRMDDSSLRTFFYEAMSIVNSRPLTVDNLSDPNSPEPLTPNHLLTMKSKAALPPPGNFIKEDIYARKRWRQVQYLSEQFWSRWKREYLSNIATRQKWHTPKRNLKIGDVVMEKMDDLPRNEWRLARVMDVVTDKDGLVRKVKIRFGERKMENGQSSRKLSIVERPVQKLILLLETV